VASYNVHRCVGVDGRRAPERIARVLREIDADVVGLQEVGPGHGSTPGFDPWAHLGELTGYRWIPGPLWLQARGGFGNGIFTRLEIRDFERVDLSVPGREPRGALDATLDWDGARVRVVAAHLGLSRTERRDQGHRLIARLRDCDAAISILLGDFNEWLSSSAALQRLHRLFGRGTAVASFPSPMPLLALDRIWVRPPSSCVEAWSHRSWTARIASDHLPVVADLSGP